MPEHQQLRTLYDQIPIQIRREAEPKVCRLLPLDPLQYCSLVVLLRSTGNMSEIRTRIRDLTGENISGHDFTNGTRFLSNSGLITRERSLNGIYQYSITDLGLKVAVWEFKRLKLISKNIPVA